MRNPSLFLPGFHLQTLRRKPKTEKQKLQEKIEALKAKTLTQLGDFFKFFIPANVLSSEERGHWSRHRLFNKENTFWAFFSQTLDADGGCKEVVRKVQAVAALKSITLSSSTAAYCKARKKLTADELDEIFQFTTKNLSGNPTNGLLQNRRVIVVDGTGVSMPDTTENQEVWPQQTSQTPGCGFPQARICACFSLHTGALLSYELGNKKNHELPLLRKQYHVFQPNDIFLGDKGFCSYYDISAFNDRHVDSVITLARRIPETELTAIKVLGKDDLLIQWCKPKKNKRLSYNEEAWLSLPDKLILRQIKVTVNQPGFRVESFYIVTTLLDPIVYPAHEISELYLQRWDVELFFRDIKTTMGMDILRCKTPAMIEKEILMHFIAYNCIRRLIAEAADKHQAPVGRLSFKASMQAFRQWEPHVNNMKVSNKEIKQLLSSLHDSIANTIVPDRSGRNEPRCVKRRPKPYQLLTAPRHEMKEIKHRSKYRAKAA